MPSTTATHEDYFAQCTPQARDWLQQVQAVVEQQVPGAVRCIGYSMPAFRQQRIFLYFAAFKKHMGVYPPLHDDTALVAETARYRGPKGNLSFPYSEPLPVVLIGRVAKALAAQYAKSCPPTPTPNQGEPAMNHQPALLMGKPLWAVALAMALALPSALAQAPAKPAPKTLPGSAWKIDFGRGVTGTVFLFCKKGRWEIVPQRAGSIGAIGTSYKESGNTLTTVNSAGGQTEKWAMSRDGEVLVLNDGTTTLRLHYNGETQC